MKSVSEIERLSLEQLESISLDEGIEVPSGLEERITLPVEYSPRRTIFLRVGGIAATVAVLVGVGLALAPHRAPLEDTFDDPRLAYAAIESALGKISSSLETGVNSVAKSEEILINTININFE